MAAKCAFIEKVGAVYYVRKRIPRAWKGRVDGEVLRLSLRTKDRMQALKRGLEALAVFEELLSMDPEEALKHLTRQLIDEQLLKPKAMTGSDLVRRRALASVGSKIIRRAREELGLGANLDAIYQELVLLNRANLEGEAFYTNRPPVEKEGESPESKLDLSGFDAVLEMLGAQPPAGTANAGKPLQKTPRQPNGELGERTALTTSKEEDVYTLRYLLNDYLKRQGKSTGSDNRANLERAVRMFEDLCPEVKTLAVPAIPLRLWDDLHEFAQHIPKLRGQAKPENLVEFTRKLQAEKKDYPKLEARTVNSNYLGAVTRLVRHGAKRRLFAYEAPYMSVAESKRATVKKARVPFSSEEITAISGCPVYAGCVARHRRYTPGDRLFQDDHVFWAPLIAMHSGMRVSEIGMLRFEQLQDWFGRPTLVLELEDEESNGEEGYKTGNALRRIPVHGQLINLGFLDFWEWQKRQGHTRLFPAWTRHIKGQNTDAREVHYEADFFNLHRLKWNVTKSRQAKTTFHSFRGFFIQACHDAKIDPYTILKFVGHDDETEARTSEVHRNYMSSDLSPDEVTEIDRVKVPIAPILPFSEWLKQ